MILVKNGSVVKIIEKVPRSTNCPRRSPRYSVDSAKGGDKRQTIKTRKRVKI